MSYVLDSIDSSSGGGRGPTACINTTYSRQLPFTIATVSHARRPALPSHARRRPQRPRRRHDEGCRLCCPPCTCPERGVFGAEIPSLYRWLPSTICEPPLSLRALSRLLIFHRDSFDLDSFFQLHDLNRYACLTLLRSPRSSVCRDGVWDRDEIEAIYGVHHVYSQRKSKVDLLLSCPAHPRLTPYACSRMKSITRKRLTISSRPSSASLTRITTVRSP